MPGLEAFNVWLGLDYRPPRPGDRGLTALGTLVSAGLTVLGAVVAARRGWTAVWLGVATGAAALALASWRHAISFEASALIALAPGLGLAAAVGVLWLQRRSPRAEGLGLMLGGGVAAGVLVSCALVYTGARVTPDERFEELASIDSRYAGRGPLLVNDREDYAGYPPAPRPPRPVAGPRALPSTPRAPPTSTTTRPPSSPASRCCSSAGDRGAAAPATTSSPRRAALPGLAPDGAAPGGQAGSGPGLWEAPSGSTARASG